MNSEQDFADGQIQIRCAEKVGTLVFNNPVRKNAINAENVARDPAGAAPTD
ncbi:hypothetical protein [Rhizobium sp. RAF56]|jgi:enoyl-CoA hydratase/carnithine racemase|uniref:hypothetical protein n=1 Tax=Rhizobium sp. RAF56 TaxID=3233062 RepID=UPI003F94FAC5